MRYFVFLSAASAALLLTGCAGLDEAMTYPSSFSKVSMPDDTYRVFHKPGERKIMVTPSVGAAMKQGAVSGVSYGAANIDTPESRLREAGQRFLEQNGLAKCTVGQGRELVRWQYEFIYSCS